jgi:hypothetical protein
MKTTNVISLNAIVWLAFGVAYGLFPYIMMNLYSIPDIPENSQAGLLLYNNILAFARIFGATMMVLGLLTYSVRTLPANPDFPVEIRRGIISALLFGNAILLFIGITEQFRNWLSIGGWLNTLVPAIFFALYIYLLATSFKGEEQAS